MFLIGLYKYFPYGGLQKDTLRVIEEALARGHQVRCMTTEWQGDKPDNKNFQLDFIKARGLANTARMDAFGRQFSAAADKLRASGDGISLAMNRFPNADFYFAADSCRKIVLQRKPFFSILRFLPRYRAILRQENAIFAPESKTVPLLICQQQHQDFLQAYPGLSEDRLKMLPPGINPACVNHRIKKQEKITLRRQLGVTDEQKLVICVGTNLYLKGIDRLFALLNSPELADIRLLLVGNDCPKTVEKLRKKSHFPAARFTFTGPRDDVADLLCASDLMVHLAREEGTGTVLLEAMSCGIPVVCSAVCGWSPYIAEATPETVIPEPYSEQEARTTLKKTLGNLAEITRQTISYAEKQDFSKRAAAIVDLLEKKNWRD